jgi:hypothetical protein
MNGEEITACPRLAVMVRQRQRAVASPLVVYEPVEVVFAVAVEREP